MRENDRKPHQRVLSESEPLKQTQLGARMELFGHGFNKKNQVFPGDSENKTIENSAISNANMKMRTARQKETNLKTTPKNDKQNKPKVVSNLPISKIQRALSAALFCVRMDKIGHNLRHHGTSCLQYNLIFKNRKYVKARLTMSANKVVPQQLPKYMIHPENKYYLVWTILGLLLILYSISFMPLGLVFYTDDKNIDLAENLMNIYFGMDIIVNFIVALKDELTGELVFDRKKIAWEYMTGFFLIDLLSSIPFGLMLENFGSANRLLRILKIPRLIKIVGVMKIFKLKNLLKGTPLFMFLKLNGGLLKTGSLAISTLVLLHLASCVIIALSGVGTEDIQSWIYKNNLQDAGPTTVYLTAFYFCFVTLTTIGYGDVSMNSNLEILFCIVWMLIGVAFYSMVIGIISAFFTSKDTKTSLLRSRLSMVEEFCKNLNINPELEKKLKDAITNGSDKLAYLWLTDEADIFRELNMQLKYEFLRAIHTNLITNCHFFRDKDISFVVRVVPLLKPMQIPPGEQLWLPGDYSSSIFFILEGEVGKYVVRNVESVNKNRKKIKYKAEPLPFPKKEGVVVDIGGKLMMVGRYSANSYVGEDDILFQRDRATVAMATKKTSMMVLSKVDMETIIQEEFPHIYGQIKKLALDRAIKELETIQKIDEIGKKENEFYEAIDYARKNKRTEADIHKQTHLLTMYGQTLDSFPLEQMIGESADLEPPLPLKSMADDEMVNLLTTLQDCKEELRQRNQAELLIKQNLEKKIKANLKKHEFGLDSKESSSMKSPELSTKIELEKKKELYQQLKKTERTA